MDYQEYKRLHAASMANNTGSSPQESGILLTTVPLGVFLTMSLAQIVPIHCHPFIDFFIVVMPIVLNVTILSDYFLLLPFQFLLLTVAIFLWKLGSVGFSNVTRVLNESFPEKKSYITNYRACTNIVSVICIMAVDFVIFPRRLAKTDSYGYGLMDLGVGFFVCCNGMVVKKLDCKQNLWKVVKGSSPLLLLGIIRLLSTKSIDYNEHAEEYGTHWNFFFTLAFCKIVSQIVMTWTGLSNPFLLTLLTAAAHEVTLHYGLKDWVFSNTPRMTLINANREGISSILGYVSLFFAAVCLGRIINDVPRHTTRLRLILKLTLICVASWTLCFVCEVNIGVSRRLANLGYSLWIISLTMAKIIQFMIVEVLLVSTKQEQTQNDPCVPVLLQAINKNGLFFFLLGNLLTGIVNLTFRTLLLDTLTSVYIITAYIALACTSTYILYLKHVTIKVW